MSCLRRAGHPRASRPRPGDQQPPYKSATPQSAALTDFLPLFNNPFSNSSSVILPFLNFFKSLVSLRSSSMSSSSMSEPWGQRDQQNTEFLGGGDPSERSSSYSGATRAQTQVTTAVQKFESPTQFLLKSTISTKPVRNSELTM